MKPTDNREAAIWYQKDAKFLYALARDYRDAGNSFMATKVQENAAYSALQARQYAA